ncbi:copper resistance protein CopC [Micromonospora sp. R77]|uniref:copper resistance CopC family protein n=1 Tax=Micromonospora sp. R77 TaxID=2925836 RepID=UPI001F60E3EA|nr:copper resistance protein CopC [Micromonospora sp. R77]MCI4065927.1 copper resistance protein CopC [Micromonospora sp. R77]
MRRLLRVLAVVALAGLTVPVGSTPAQAHAYLAASAPADGAVLDAAPETISLSFTEHVELAAARIALVDGDGRHWAVTGLALRDADGAPAAPDADSEEPVTLVAGLPALPPNTYHVTWRTLSTDDLHTTSGTLVFGVGRQVTAAGTSGPVGPGPRETIARALGLLGLAVLLGGAALALLHTTLPTLATRRRPAPSPHRAQTLGDPGQSPFGTNGNSPRSSAVRRRLLVVAGYAGAVALLAAPLQLAIQLAGADGARWRLLADQLTSGRWLLREAGTATLLTVVALAAHRSRPVARPTAPPTDSATGPAGPAADSPQALPGRTGSARPGAGPRPSSSACSARWPPPWGPLLGHPMGGASRTALVGGIHVLAAGAWAGAVLAAALALLPLIRRTPDRSDQVRALLRAFAVLAAGCLTLLVLTGLLLTGPQVATVDALLGSPYGLLLLGKVAVAGAAGLLGLRTARRLRRADLPRRGLLVEAGLLAVALGLAGALAAAGPGRGPAFPTAAAARAEPQVSGQVADLVDTVAVRPNRPGRNIVSISVGDTRRPAPGPVTGVSLLLTGPNGARAVHPVTRTADGWVATVDDIRTPGDWRVGVTVLRDGLPPVTDTHPWLVPAADPTGPAVRVSAAPLRPVLDRAALLLTLVGVAVVAVVGRRWRHRIADAAPTPERPVGGVPDDDPDQPVDGLAVTGGIRAGP